MTSPGENTAENGAESGLKTTMVYLFAQSSRFAERALNALNNGLFGAPPAETKDGKGASVIRVMEGRAKGQNSQVGLN